MRAHQTVGLLIIGLGVVILGVTLGTIDAPLQHLSNALITHYAEQATWYLAIGSAALIAGGILVLPEKETASRGQRARSGHRSRRE